MSKGQRVKGNAKAASSAAAAELLLSLGKTPLIGFDTPTLNVFQAIDQADQYEDLDSEAKVLLKKLTKKDPQTREKGLREFLDYLRNCGNSKSIELCCPHFVSMFTRLALDGSPTVRSLSLRVASHLLQTLKKSTERHLKTIIPIVLFANSDSSAAVGNEATSLVKDCFPEAKRKTACALFALNATNFAVECASGQNEILQKQKYDDEETESERRHRIQVQALKTLTVLSQIVSEKEEFNAALLPLFTAQIVKKLLNTEGFLEKQFLLKLSLLVSDPVDVLISSNLAQFVSTYLDNPHQNLADVSNQVFEKLTEDDRFYEKFNLKKAVVPRVLNVIRKKQMFWKILPASFPKIVMNLYNHLPVEDAVQFLISSLDSFLDNLPFDGVPCFSEWATCLNQIARFAAEKEMSQQQQLQYTSTVLKAVDIIVPENEDAQGQVAELVVQIVQKKRLQEEALQNFVDVLRRNLLNSRPASLLFISKISGFCLDEFLELHVAACTDEKSPFQAFSCLIDKENDEYLLRLDEKVSFCKILPEKEWTRAEAEQMVGFLTNKLQENLEKIIEIKPNLFGRVFLSESTLPWEKLGKFAEVDVLKQIMKQCVVDGDFESAKKLLQKMPKSERMTVLEKCSEEKSEKATLFLRSIVGCVELDSEHAEVFVDAIFSALFLDSSKSIGDLSEVLKKHKPSEACRRRIVMESVQDGENRIDRVAHLIGNLLDEDVETYSVLLSNEEDLEKQFEKSKFLHLDLALESGILSKETSWKRSAMGFEFDEIWSDQDAEFKLLQAKLYSKIQCKEDQILERARFLAVFHDLCLQKWSNWKTLSSYQPLDFETTVLQSALKFAVSQLETDTATLEKATPILAVVRHTVEELRRRNVECGKEIGFENPSFWLRATLRGKEIQRKTDWESLVGRFFGFDESHVEILERLRSDVQKNEDMAGRMFSADFLPNAIALKRICSILESVNLDSLNPDLVDFVMCGLVTLFESADAIIFAGDVSHQIQLELSFALKAFALCSGLSRKQQNPRFDNEWTGFYAPALGRFVLRWTTNLVKSQEQPTVFVRSLARAIGAIQEPIDVDYDAGVWAVCSPEYDAFNYSVQLQSLMYAASSLATSSQIVIQIIGLHLLKLLAPTMYRKENGDWAEDKEQNQLSAEKKLKIPIVLWNLAKNPGLSSLLAFDAALTPLARGTILSEEERVAYCDVLLVFVNKVMPSLISTCPENIPRTDERSWLLSEDTIFDKDLIGRYACGLLYRSLSLLPAIIRIWYTALPSNASQIVNRYIKSHNVSKLLIDQELSKVKLANRDGTITAGSPLKVRVVPATGEVVAEYTVDETKMVLSICLPQDYPLRVPTIQIDKAVVPNERAKKWLLQLTSYLFHKNGSLVDGILMWRRNVDKDVEGAEACCICMMTIHTNNHQLPKVKCRQCKNKFHSNCLYKWFESSNQATCPLCRTNFT